MNRIRSGDAQSGFTLMELMVVLIIVGILGAIAAPNMSRVFGHDRLRGSTTSVTTSLYLARLKAINQGEPFGVSFNDDGTFQVVRDPYDEDEDIGTPYSLDNGLSFAEVTFVDRLAVFNEQGQLHKNCLDEGTMTALVRITDGSPDTTAVEVTCLSGRIRETNR